MEDANNSNKEDSTNNMIEPNISPASIPNENFTKICSHCGQPGFLRCSRCNIERYCSKECQKLRWKIHKLYCKK